ncbi:ProQ/FINO family protein [Photobacterium sp. ZSDE20]|uniref:ProQ/FINO family protein n=1 Tax=Photobacterium pectinilyticum TaxID=2906793 RepID=A0ABT1N8M4_9GAMM|nr:ProQ/FINO family protein [Photobacterium sp. ZSDE20]MCQ1061081.1 ProQ/FINO family protein [Photobacterium sp. ZSDE20]MDD1826200.1 ProQ/FINO family protein [Photobacterium sp. ZSDE20]
MDQINHEKRRIKRIANKRLMAIEPFSSNLPLAVGLGKIIINDEALMEGITVKAVRNVLGAYTSKEVILRKLVKDGLRYDLNGQASKATTEHLAYAREKLNIVKAKRLAIQARKK